MSTSGKHIVLVTQQQFGYNTDFYYFAKYLSTKHKITYICWDQRASRIDLAGIDVVYVSSDKNFFSRSIDFLSVVISKTDKESVVIVKYFKIMSLILRILLPFNSLVLDIRSGAVLGSHLERKLRDTLLIIEAFFYKNITIVSKSLALTLKLDRKAEIIPLGADQISKSSKFFDEFNLLYVGTLYNRSIEKTIIGLSSFYKEYSSKIKIRYTIIGGSPLSSDMESLLSAVKIENLEGVVNIVGIVPHDNLKKYFDTHNIGVSFIPMTPYYDCQPPTKTFEYLMSGMPVIATSTSEHLKVVCECQNGTLIADTPKDFYRGLVNLYDYRKHFDSELIRESVKSFSWIKICSRLDSYLTKL